MCSSDLAALELVAAAMFSATLIFLLYLTVFVFFGLAAMTSGEVRSASVDEVPVSQGNLRAFPLRIGVLSAKLFLGVLVLTIGLFLILPRTARAALGRFAPQRERLTGFSNSVTLGEIGRIKQSNAPVMHVRSYQNEGFLPVKWRGTALAEFDGKRWFNPPDPDRVVRIDGGNIALRTAVIGNRAGRNLIYQVHLEPMVSDKIGRAHV